MRCESWSDSRGSKTQKANWSSMVANKNKNLEDFSKKLKIDPKDQNKN